MNTLVIETGSLLFDQEESFTHWWSSRCNMFLLILASHSVADIHLILTLLFWETFNVHRQEGNARIFDNKIK
jgi:hypothetical protein